MPHPDDSSLAATKSQCAYQSQNIPSRLAKMDHRIAE
jgi:hypothetical protein